MARVSTKRAPKRAEFREIARKIAEDSVVVGALGRFIEQIVEETHRIATENERERAAKVALAVGNAPHPDGCGDIEEWGLSAPERIAAAIRKGD